MHITDMNTGKVIKAMIVTVAGVLISLVAFSQGISKAIIKDSLPYLSKPPASVPAVKKPIGFEQIIPQNYYTQHLGFFCRQELKMQQAKIPVTFRVGSMDQCNTLEQKPGYR